MRIALFITCLNDTLFPHTGQAVVRVLERLGHRVDFPAAQTCCGQLHLNSGYPNAARALARNFVSVFAQAEAVVIPSTACTAMVRTQFVRLAEDDPALASAVASLLPRVHEFSEFLTRILRIEDVGAAFAHRVTYHPACSGLRALALGDSPVRLLHAVRGLALQPLPDAEQCCGFGGTFAIKNADTSAAMLTDKMAAVLASGAEICTSGDNSCLMHLGGALARLRSGRRVMHLAEILASES